MWESGLTNYPIVHRYNLAARSLVYPGWWVFNAPGPGIETPGSLVAPPGVVLPDDYHFQEVLGAGPFPYGMAVEPDH